MTDRELLEYAAKAAGMWKTDFSLNDDDQPDFSEEKGFRLAWGAGWWNPIEDDGDALRLAVKAGISPLVYPACIWIRWPQIGLPIDLIGTDEIYEDISSGQDSYAATRRAIVRAAAEIGRAMK